MQVIGTFELCSKFRRNENVMAEFSVGVMPEYISYVDNSNYSGYMVKCATCVLHAFR